MVPTPKGAPPAGAPNFEQLFEQARLEHLRVVENLRQESRHLKARLAEAQLAGVDAQSAESASCALRVDAQSPATALAQGQDSTFNWDLPPVQANCCAGNAEDHAVTVHLSPGRTTENASVELQVDAPRANYRSEYTVTTAATFGSSHSDAQPLQDEAFQPKNVTINEDSPTLFRGLSRGNSRGFLRQNSLSRQVTQVGQQLGNQLSSFLQRTHSQLDESVLRMVERGRSQVTLSPCHAVPIQTHALHDARAHWRRFIRKERNKKALREPVSNHARETVEQTRTMLQRFVSSRFYEMTVIVLVITNTAFIGWQVQYQATSRNSTLEIHSYGENAFCAIFSAELILRIVSDGWQFFLCISRDKAWNRFDFVVVSFMLLEFCMETFFFSSSSMLEQVSMLRVLRVVRLVRVLRIIRVLKFFRELRMMIASIITSFTSLMWATLVLLVVFYIFGITLTQGVVDLCSENAAWTAEENQLMISKFGSIETSILSLFQAMSGGINWGELYIALHPLSPVYKSLFLLFVSFAVFAVVNIVTGIFVDSAIQSSAKDKEALIQEEMRHKEAYMRSIGLIFQDMDIASEGTVSLDHFKQAIQDERMVAYFNALELDITDVESLFVLLDRDQSGTIDIEEFLLGCLRLKGAAKNLDLAKLMYESDWLVQGVENLQASIRELMVHLHMQVASQKNMPMWHINGHVPSSGSPAPSQPQSPGVMPRDVGHAQADA